MRLRTAELLEVLVELDDHGLFNAARLELGHVLRQAFQRNALEVKSQLDSLLRLPDQPDLRRFRLTADNRLVIQVPARHPATSQNNG